VCEAELQWQSINNSNSNAVDDQQLTLNEINKEKFEKPLIADEPQWSSRLIIRCNISYFKLEPQSFLFFLFWELCYLSLSFK